MCFAVVSASFFALFLCLLLMIVDVSPKKRLEQVHIAVERGQVPALQSVSSRESGWNLARIPADPENFWWAGEYHDLTVQLAWEAWQEAGHVAAAQVLSETLR